MPFAGAIYYLCSFNPCKRVVGCWSLVHGNHDMHIYIARAVRVSASFAKQISIQTVRLHIAQVVGFASGAIPKGE